MSGVIVVVLGEGVVNGMLGAVMSSCFCFSFIEVVVEVGIDLSIFSLVVVVVLADLSANAAVVLYVLRIVPVIIAAATKRIAVNNKCLVVEKTM